MGVAIASLDYYRVMVHGTGLDLVIDDEPGIYGFYVARFVQAQDPDAAVETALELLRRDPKLVGADTNPPKLAIDTVERLPHNVSIAKVQPGLAFYREDGSDEGAA